MTTMYPMTEKTMLKITRIHIWNSMYANGMFVHSAHLRFRVKKGVMKGEFRIFDALQFRTVRYGKMRCSSVLRRYGLHSNTIEGVIGSVIDDPINSWFWGPNN